MNPALDLYAKIEPLIGFYDAYEHLYKHYLKFLKKFEITTLLDVGCGSGRFLKILNAEGYQARGIEISPSMAEIAAKKGLDVSCKKLEEVEGKYTCITAVADVLNYMEKNDLQNFLDDVFLKLEDNGYFIADINTLHGFEDVTAGSLVKSGEDYLLAIDAEFENGVLHTSIDYFEKDGENYRREHGEIKQYRHSKKEIEKMTEMKCHAPKPIALFSDIADKKIVIFQKKV